MCLSIPGKIVEAKGDDVVVDYGAEKREAKNFIDAKLGEWVIISNKIVVIKVPEEQAEAYLDSIKNVGENVNK